MGLADEIRDVARRIALVTGRTEDRSDAVRALRLIALRLHRSYEAACNREQTTAEVAREEADESSARLICQTLGVPVHFCADPRGAPIQIPIPHAREHSNYASGEHIAIPWLPAREYR